MTEPTECLPHIVAIRHPTDYTASEGARFEVHIEKGRGIHGDQAKPFEAKLEVQDGRAIWTMKDIEDANLARVRALLDDGMSIRDIADETGIKKSTVHYMKKKIEAGKDDVGQVSKPVSKTSNGCPTVQAPREFGQLDSHGGQLGQTSKAVSNGNRPALGPGGPDDDVGYLDGGRA